MHVNDWCGVAQPPALQDGPKEVMDHPKGYEVGYQISTVMGMGCYENQRAGQYGGRHAQCLVSVACSGP